MGGLATGSGLQIQFHPYLPFLRKETILKAVYSLLHFPSADFVAQADSILCK
jgi:hypothetical protein